MRALSEKGDTGSRDRVRPWAPKAALAIAGIFLLYMATVQGWHFARSSLVETGVLSAGELKRTYTSEGVLIKDETAIPSPADGELVMRVKPGERVRAGESIAEVKTAGDGAATWSALIRASRTGIVSLSVDGLEGVLKPGQADILEAVRLSEVNAKQGNPMREGLSIKCVKGQPVLKVIDNLSPLLIYVQAPIGFPDEALKKESITLLWEHQEFSGRIKDIPPGNNAAGRMLAVQILNYPAGLLEIRKDTFKLVVGKVSGYIVPQKALVIRDGVEGLYIMDKQGTRWTPVKVEGIVDGSAAVTGERLSPGTRYVISPNWLSTRE